MGRPRDHLILERRRQDELREEVNTIIKYSKQFDLKVHNKFQLICPLHKLPPE